MIRLLRNALLLLLLMCALLWLLANHLGWQPAPREALPVACRGPATPLVPGQTLKVMSWNIQYLAGKGYVFIGRQSGREGLCGGSSSDGGRARQQRAQSDGHVVENHRGKTDHGVVQRVCHVHFGLDRDREWHQQQSDP